MPDKPDVKEASDLYDRLSAYAIKLDISTPASTKSRIIKLVTAFRSFIESIEQLMPLKTDYGSYLAHYISLGICTVHQGVIAWQHSCSDAKYKNKMADRLHRIDSLRYNICDNARIIMTITAK